MCGMGRFAAGNLPDLERIGFSEGMFAQRFGFIGNYLSEVSAVRRLNKATLCGHRDRASAFFLMDARS
ncbi:hypothetical protein BW247_05980 [Acidihalobacter ferrooxydans]|uniref:Uncharacterized protein n=1 Tax=Acidihalobacter ferrooxydans TaxID=1765967 RepID=A0A1P8UFS4_9GAMM|nr:hypothetical protein BW247_05980 [Acidihalobacter ferrooxydans]